MAAFAVVAERVVSKPIPPPQVLRVRLGNSSNFATTNPLYGRGLAKSGELIMRPIREAMEKNLLAIYKGKVKLVLSELKESDAAVLGASALGWEAS